MVNLPKFLKAYRDAGAFHSLLAPHRFVEDGIFLTKSGQLGIVLAADGIDYECLTEASMESASRRAANAWRGFDDRFRLYQYVFKNDNATIEQSGDYESAAVRKTVAARRAHLTKSGLYTIKLYYVVVLDAATAPTHELSTKKLLRELSLMLDHNLTMLRASVDAFQRNIGDLVGLRALGKREAFSFLRLLVNLDSEIAASEALKYDAHVDFFLPGVALACTDSGMRIGDAQVEVLSLKEPPSSTFPNILRDLLKLEMNFILCTEFKRVQNEKAVSAIRAAQNHFHWSQWVSDIPSLLSLVMNRGNRANVIADKSALNEVEDLDQTLARVNNGAECPTKILLASPGADLSEYRQVFKLNDKEVQLYAELVPKRQFLLKTNERSKVLNVDLDDRAVVEYANSPFENARRADAIAVHGYEAGIELLAGARK